MELQHTGFSFTNLGGCSIVKWRRGIPLQRSESRFRPATREIVEGRILLSRRNSKYFRAQLSNPASFLSQSFKYDCPLELHRASGTSSDNAYLNACSHPSIINTLPHFCGEDQDWIELQIRCRCRDAPPTSDKRSPLIICGTDGVHPVSNHFPRIKQ